MQTSKELSGFSERLKAARRDMYTQEKLSEASNVGYRSIQRYESIKKSDNPTDKELLISTSNLLRLAEALDVTPEWLLLGEEDMKIYMTKLESELKALTKDEIYYYHKQPLTDKVLSHLKLTDKFIDNIQQYWKDHTLSCYRNYVQDTIIRYCHNRPKK